MLLGNAGVGKPVIVSDRLAILSVDYLLVNIPLNYYMTSAVLLSKLIWGKLALTLCFHELLCTCEQEKIWLYLC